MLYNTHPRLVGYSDCELDDIVDTHMHGMPPSPRGGQESTCNSQAVITDQSRQEPWSHACTRPVIDSPLYSTSDSERRTE